MSPNVGGMTIDFLADYPEAVPLLARWFHTEWSEFDGRSKAAIEAQLKDNLHADSIPTTFVARSESEIVGTVSLDLFDLPLFEHLSPWLSSLYVLPRFRGAGIGTALVRHAQLFAWERALSPLHLWTAGPTRLYERCGWTVVERATYNSRPITLMRFQDG